MSGKSFATTMVKAMLTAFHWRVKCYTLDDEYQWVDKGCGFVTAEFKDQVKDISLVVRSEEDGTVMLDSVVKLDTDAYSNQQDTLVLWKEADGTDLALSFESKEGCEDLFDLISRLRTLHTRKHIAEHGPGELPHSPSINDISFEEDSDIDTLPPPELKCLDALTIHLKTVSTFFHEKTAGIILRKDYIQKLIELFLEAERKNDLITIHKLYTVFKAIFDLGEASIVEEICDAGLLMEVIGVLEYVPGCEKQVHRNFITKISSFKEVIPIGRNGLEDRIHTSYRLSYLRDVVLGCVPEEPSNQAVTACINNYNRDIIRGLSADRKFLAQLFGELQGKNGFSLAKGKHSLDLLRLLRAVCQLAITMPPLQKIEIMEVLMEQGLLEPLTSYLLNENCSSAVTEVLNVLLTDDCSLIQTQILKVFKQSKEGEAVGPRLIYGLTSVIIEGKQPDAISTTTELLQTLMHSENVLIQQRGTLQRVLWEECVSRLLLFLEDFSCSDNLRITENSHRIYHAVDCVASFLSDHGRVAVVRAGLMGSMVLPKVAFMINHREKHLALAALRLIRAVISTEDETYAHYIHENDCLAPVVHLLVENAPRQNMLYSAAFSLLNTIYKENIVSLLSHLVTMHSNTLQPLIPNFDKWIEKQVTNDRIASGRKRQRATQKPRGRPWSCESSEMEDDWLEGQARLSRTTSSKDLESHPPTTPTGSPTTPPPIINHSNASGLDSVYINAGLSMPSLKRSRLNNSPEKSVSEECNITVKCVVNSMAGSMNMQRFDDNNERDEAFELSHRRKRMHFNEADFTPIPFKLDLGTDGDGNSRNIRKNQLGRKNKNEKEKENESEKEKTSIHPCTTGHSKGNDGKDGVGKGPLSPRDNRDRATDREAECTTSPPKPPLKHKPRRTCEITAI